MIDGKKNFDHPINNDNGDNDDDYIRKLYQKTYENIRKIATGKEDDQTTWLFVRLSLFLRKL